MLPKNSRKNPIEATKAELKPYFQLGKKLLIFGIIGEVCCLAASYFGFRKLNQSIEFRQHCAKHYPIILEGFYYISDDLAGTNTREKDLAAWALPKVSWEENDVN